MFNLLIRSAPAARQMRYTLPFTGPGGEPYLFVGVKEVRDEAGFDAWADTTTLFTTIYRSNRRTGRWERRAAPEHPRSGPPDDDLPVPARPEARETLLAALVGFSRFFIGQLWDTYIRHRLSSRGAARTAPSTGRLPEWPRIAAFVRRPGRSNRPCRAGATRPW